MSQCFIATLKLTPEMISPFVVVDVALDDRRFRGRPGEAAATIISPRFIKTMHAARLYGPKVKALFLIPNCRAVISRDPRTHNK